MVWIHFNLYNQLYWEGARPGGAPYPFKIGRNSTRRGQQAEIVRSGKWLSLPGDNGRGPASTSDEDLSHVANRLEALRTGKQPSVPVTAGYAHSVACIMAAQAYREGKRLYWDPKTETILDHPA